MPLRWWPARSLEVAFSSVQKVSLQGEFQTIFVCEFSSIPNDYLSSFSKVSTRTAASRPPSHCLFGPFADYSRCLVLCASLSSAPRSTNRAANTPTFSKRMEIWPATFTCGWACSLWHQLHVLSWRLHSRRIC